MSLVIDSSIAIKWFVRETWHEEALGLAERDEALLAPDLIVAEVTNTAWKKALRGEVTSAQAAEIATRIGTGLPTLCEAQLLNEEALRIALALEHPVYDCLYLACARLFDAVMVTDDQRLCRAVAGSPHAPLVLHISQA